MIWWRRLRHRDRLERELDAELRDHVERQTADYIAGGMPAADARRRTLVEFGGLEPVKETCRDARGLALLDETLHDARYAVRILRANPGFTVVAVLTLALGIGANTAVFALLNGLHLRQLPVESPDALVFVSNCTGSDAVIDELRARRDIFQSAAGWMATQFSLDASGQTEWVDGLWVTGQYFDTLGVPAQVGRTLTPTAGASEAMPSEPMAPEAMISDGLWRRRFGGSRSVIGRTVTINHRPFTVVGVTPRGFTGIDVGRTFDVIAPFNAYALLTGRAPEVCGPLSVVARLANGQTLEGAGTAVLEAQPRIRQRLMPAGVTASVRDRYLSRPFSLASAAGGSSELRPRYERPLATIMAIAALILLIACATIANLLLARATTRRQEVSVRLALGASRWRLVRQLLMESFVVSGLGAAMGLLVAWQGSRLIITELSTEGVLATGRTIFGSARLFLDVSLDGHVLAFTTSVAVATALLFGLAPAIRASQSSSRAPRPPGTAGSLVVAQVALSLVLLVAAGLFVRSLSWLLSVPLGFQPDRMLVVDIMTPPSTGVGHRRIPVYERARELVRALPGVAEASLSVSAPMTGWDPLVEVDTGPSTERSTGSDSLANIVSPGWFRTLGTPLVAGRDFTEADGTDTRPVVIVNQAFARQLLRGAQALGRTISIRGMGSDVVSREIVGVAADALWSLRDPVPPILYVPLAQADPEALEARLADEGLTLGVRTMAAPPQSLGPQVAAALDTIGPELTLTFRSPVEHISASLTQERVVAMLSGFFGLLALLLAAVGLYGITAYSVNCRRGEIAIRLALGGSPVGVIRLVLRRVSVLVGGGVVLGIAASIWLAPLASALLYGVEPHDALTLVLAVVTLALVSALAGCVPARRAARVDPAIILRT